MDSVKEPFSIIINPKSDSLQHKSISSLSWNNIPEFSIITGRNGSGKTQLIDLLTHHFTGTYPSSYKNKADFPLEIKSSGVTYKPEEVGFVPSSGRFSGGSSASLADMSGTRRNALKQSQSLHNYQHNPAQMARAHRMHSLLGGRNIDHLSDDELDNIFPDDFRYMISDVDVAAGLAYVFVAHRFKLLEALEQGTPGIGRDGKPLGPTPWDVVNESLATAGFPYEVISPMGTPLTAHYNLTLRDRQSLKQISPNDLSSGEQVLLQLILWLYSSSKEGVFPKLLLLDEPDAHLHPSMTVQFLDVIADVLVKKYGVRVIMTTHSPSTVALAPEGSIFQMERGGKEVKKVERRDDVLAVLTSGLVTVSKASKFCFVEDEDDVSFYDVVRDILTDYGPSKDPFSLRPSPSLAFIAASVGQGYQKLSGGSSIAIKWVEKLDADPLRSTFLGLIDKDRGNRSTDRIKVIGRYSFENYLLDPANIFGLLLESGKAPVVEGLSASPGDEHLLRTQSNGILQAIVDTIASLMEATEPTLKGGLNVSVTYTRGQKITLPSWVLDYRGHDLLQVAQRAFGGVKLINRPRLLNTLRRVRLIPFELAAVLAELQGIELTPEAVS